jgi:hypothetical protein
MKAKALLDEVDAWCRKQTKVRARLVREKPMTDAQIDKIPRLLLGFPWPLPTPYDPKRFVIPSGYRALLKLAGGFRVEYRDDEKWETYEAFNFFRPGSCANAHTGQGKTLCDSWSCSGTTVDDREITTTELISFATIGYSVEASRWCFYVPAQGRVTAPAIIEESNDYECVTGRYVDTGEWLSDLDTPLFPTFETFFAALVTAVTKKPLDPRGGNDTVGQVYKLAPKIKPKKPAKQ